MLKKLTLDLKKVCKREQDPFRLTVRSVGQAYCFDFYQVLEFVKSGGRNMDDTLTAQIALAVNQQKIQAAFVAYAFHISQMTSIVVCSKYEIRLKRIEQIPGLEDEGRCPVLHDIAPFIYFDGKTIYRLHEIDPEYEKSKFLIADFGMGSGNGPMVGGTQEWRYNQIKNDPVENWDYSIVPTKTDQILNWDGEEFPIKHVSVQLIRALKTR